MEVAVGPGGAKQNAAFAVQRAAELHSYLNALTTHPIAGNAEPLQFFLTFADRDLGVAWPEVSTSALTRFTAGINKTAGEASAAAAAGMSSLGTGMNSGVPPSMNHNSMPSSMPPSHNHNSPNTGGGNNNTQAEQLAHLLSQEAHRMNLVVGSIPKIEGFLILLKDVQQSQGLLAMEWSKLSKDLKVDDKAIARLADIVGVASLKSARRNRKRVTDSVKVLHPLLQQVKVVQMEKAAFHDRQVALEKVWKLRQTYSQQNQQLSLHGSQQHMYHTHPMAQQFQAQAAHSSHILNDASGRADVISNVLYSEILRLQAIRREEVLRSLTSFAITMKDAQSDVTHVWQEAQASFNKSFASSTTLA
jgi:hypothetical protein